MSSVHRPLILNLVIFIALTASASAQTDIENAIFNQSKRLGAREYREARKTEEGDVGGNRSPDIVVLYTLEGLHHCSNDWAQSL